VFEEVLRRLGLPARTGLSKIDKAQGPVRTRVKPPDTVCAPHRALPIAVYNETRTESRRAKPTPVDSELGSRWLRPSGARGFVVVV
jgi:hypothetical protein